MANKFKKALALVLAAAMVVTVAPAPAASTAEAANKYSITKKTSVTADKTYTLKVKGVSKKQYIKVNAAKGVTVKVGSKTVKKATKTTGTVKVKGTGKAITLKVNAGDKVASYKTKLKAIVYNKKGNKKVKTLASNSKVKVSEFSITSVEAATNNTSGTIKYLVVNFGKKLSSLDPSEISIREVKSDQLFTVEKVELASNGKSATITLLGNDTTSISVGGGTVTSQTGYLERLVDYEMKITQNGATASNVFNIPAYMSSFVEAADPDKNTITVNGQILNLNGQTVDFFDILGTDVRVWFDQDQNITKLITDDYTNVYGSFKVGDDVEKDNNLKFTSMSDSSKTYSTRLRYSSDSNRATSEYVYGKNALTISLAPLAGATTGTDGAEFIKARGASDEDATYTGAEKNSDGSFVYSNAKIVLNKDGSIRRVVRFPAKVLVSKTDTIQASAVATAAGLTGKTVEQAGAALGESKSVTSLVNTYLTDYTAYYVGKVSGTYVYDIKEKNEINLKDYTIIKNNKYASISDIAAGDTIFYNAATDKKWAIVSTAKVTGTIDAVYSNKISALGLNVEYGPTVSNGINTGLRNHSKIDAMANTIATNSEGALTEAVCKEGLLQALKDVNVYTIDRLTSTLYLDGTSVNIDEDNLNKLKAGGDVDLYFGLNGNIEFIIGKEGTTVSKTNPYILTQKMQTYSAKNSSYLMGTFSDGTDKLTLDAAASSLTKVVGNATTGANTLTAENGAGIALATTSNGTTGAVVGENFATVKLDTYTTEASATYAANTVNLNAVPVGTLVEVGVNSKGEVKTISLEAAGTAVHPDNSKDVDFSKNPAVADKVTSTATPIFEYKVSASGTASVTKTTMGAYSKKVLKADAATGITVIPDSDDAKKAAYIIVDKDKTQSSGSYATIKTVVVSGVFVSKNEDGDNEISRIDVIERGSTEVTSYTKFDNPTEDGLTKVLTVAEKGQILTLGIASDGETVVSELDSDGNGTKRIGTEISGTATNGKSTEITVDGTTLSRHDDGDHSSIVYHVTSSGIELISWTDMVDDDNVDKISKVEYSKYQDLEEMVDIIVVSY